MRAEPSPEILRLASTRRGGLSSIALLVSSFVTLTAFTLLVISLLFTTKVDAGRIIVFYLIIIILAPTLFKSSRESLKTFIRRMIHRGPPGGDIVELDMNEMHYFIAGEDKDVLVITGNGSCWGRGFLILSKALPQMQSLSGETSRAEEHKMLDVFIESAYSNKLPVQSVMSLNPIDEDEIINDIPESLDVPTEMIARMGENKQLSIIHSKLGVWKSRMIMSTRSSAKPPSRIVEVIEDVHAKLLQLKALFTAAFPNYVVEKASGRREMKKIATFMLTHSEGSNLIRDGGGTTTLSGKELAKLISIPRLIKNAFPESFPYKEFRLNPLVESDIFLGSTLDDTGNPIAETGLKTSHLKQGIAVLGEEQDQLELTNKTIVSNLAASSTPYIVFTRDTKYRPLMNLIPDAIIIELGEHFTMNPLEREDIDAEQYIPLILAVFENSFPLSDEQSNMLFTILHDVYSQEAPPTLTLLRDYAENVSVSGKESLPRMRILEGVTKAITMLLSGNAGSALSGASTIQFKSLLERASPLIIIEFKGITDPTVVRFIEGTILAKLYALYASRKDSLSIYGGRMLLLEEADLLFKNAFLRYIRRAVSPAETLSKWVHELAKYGVGMHISTRSPSQLDENILTGMGTKIAHRITTIDDATIAAKHINLEPMASARRNQVGMMPVIANLPPGEALLTRPDTKRPFPVRIAQEKVQGLPVPSDSDVTSEMSRILFSHAKKIKEPSTQLQIDYPDEQDRRIAKEVLELLEEYADFGKGSIMSSFDTSDQGKVKALLPKLENYRYLISTNIEISEGRLRRVYRITEKGQKALEDERATEKATAVSIVSNAQEQNNEVQTSAGESNKTELDAGLRPIFMGAIGGLRMARKLFKADKFALTLQRINETLTTFLNNLAEKRDIGIELDEENSLQGILRTLSYSDLPLPPDKATITWISERAAESMNGETLVAKEQALKALQDAVSFLKQTARIYHIE